MEDVTDDVTRRLFLVRNRHRARKAWMVLFPMVLAGAAAVSIVLCVSLFLPPVPGRDTWYYDEELDEECDREVSAASVLLPRAVTIGLVTGALVFAPAVNLGDRMAWIFSASTVCLFVLVGILAPAILFGNGAPSSSYLGASATDIFWCSCFRSVFPS